jgi:hypothetical protein
MTTADKTPGANTRAEILSQPQCWKACFHAWEESRQLEDLAGKFPRDAEVLFIG